MTPAQPAAAAPQAAAAADPHSQEHPAVMAPETLSLEVVTEHLGFAPVQFIDSLIEAVNTNMYAATAQLEARVSADLGAGVETEKGMASVETLFENSVDRRFDRLEVFCLRNVFAVPADVASRMHTDHDAGALADASHERELDMEIEQLRKRLLASRYMKAKMDEEELYLEHAGQELLRVGAQWTSLETLAKDHGVFPLDATTGALASHLQTLQQSVEDMSVRSSHPSMRQRVLESDTRTRLLQSEIAMHIRKRKQLEDSGCKEAGAASTGGEKPVAGKKMKVSAWDVTREYRDAMGVGSVKEIAAFKEFLLAAQ
ncbi:Mis12 protein-domain-containing protein [Entophlyctis helioformis]|nr:Mis12 protein-domain-containing protein [Entophlyctis helioformis]